MAGETYPYGNVEEEYWTVRKGAGLSDLSHLGRLTVTGKDRVSFLNGLLTNDLAKLTPNSGIHCALLNAKARVLADLHLYDHEESLVMDTGDSPALKVKAILDQFIITEDAQVKDSSQELLQISIQGPKASNAIEQIFGVETEALTALSSKQVGPSLVIVRDRTGLGGYDIMIPIDEAEAVWQGLLLKGGENGQTRRLGSPRGLPSGKGHSEIRS